MAAEFNPRDFRRGLRDASITDAEYRVAVELCEHAGIGKPVVWPSVPTLAENCCMKDRAVQYILRRLESKGVIACENRSKGGRGQTSRWRLLTKTVHSHAPFTDPETVHHDSRNGAPARPKTVHGHAPEEVIEEERRSAARAPAPADAAPRAPRQGSGQKPVNDEGASEDGLLLESWERRALTTM